MTKKDSTNQAVKFQIKHFFNILKRYEKPKTSIRNITWFDFSRSFKARLEPGSKRPRHFEVLGSAARFHLLTCQKARLLLSVHLTTTAVILWKKQPQDWKNNGKHGTL